MNILSIENKFKELDEKEKSVREYFDPKSIKGKKHHYISDIRADFQYDTLLYGLGNFWMKDSETYTKDDQKLMTPSESEVIPEDTKIDQYMSHSYLMRTPNKPAEIVVAKRKNMDLLKLQDPLLKKNWVGTFSDIKYLNKEYFYKKPSAVFGTSGWKTAAVGDRAVKNKAARVQTIYSSRIKDRTDDISKKIKEYKCDSPHKRQSNHTNGITKEEFKNYLEECKELVFIGKNPKKFELGLEKLRKETGKKENSNKPQLFQIFFLNSMNLEVKSENTQVSVSLTDISAQSYPTHHFLNLKTENSVVLLNRNSFFDLKSIFGEDITNHTIRVLIQGEVENIDYYVCLQDYKDSLEQHVKSQIIEYKLAIYEIIKSQTKQSRIVPLTLQRIAEKSLAKPSKIAFPIISSKPTPLNIKKKNYANPLTSALFSYKQNTESFHPQAYPANLSIFEAHDFIEENYSLPPKSKKKDAKPAVNLGISGQGLNNSYLNI